MGIRIRLMSNNTIFWKLSSRFSNTSDLVHTVARPIMMASTRAVITLTTGGMSRRKINSGNCRKVSFTGSMERCGIRVYPETIAKKAAPMEER